MVQLQPCFGCGVGESLHPGGPGHRLAHRNGLLNAEKAVRTTGLLTARRNPGTERTPSASRSRPKGNYPRAPDCGSSPLPGWEFLAEWPPSPAGLPAPGSPCPGDPVPWATGPSPGLPPRRHPAVPEPERRSRRFWRGRPARVSRTTCDSVGEATSAARRAAPNGGHCLPHRGKTGTPPNQGREVFGDALYTLDAQPHRNPDRGGENHPEMPCNRSGGGRTADSHRSRKWRARPDGAENVWAQTQPNPALPVRLHKSTRPDNSRGQPVGGVSRLLQAVQEADPNRPDHHLSLGTGPRLVLNTVQGIAHRGLTDLSGVRNLGVGQTPAEQAQ